MLSVVTFQHRYMAPLGLTLPLNVYVPLGGGVAPV